MYKLHFAKLFREDVQSSVDYIKHTLHAPAAAERLKGAIKKTYKKIKDAPFMYPAVPNDYLASIGFRFAIVKNYMLFYIAGEKEIYVIRFLYGHRNWIHILHNTNVMEN